MAVATEREYGLFSDGAFVEPASGEVRDLTEPATGALLARASMAGEADIDRVYLETKSVVTYTGTRPTNPFGL